MSFILEIGLETHQEYVGDWLISFFASREVPANVSRIGAALVVETDENDPRLEQTLETLNTTMPFSLFMRSISHRFSEEPFQRFTPTAQEQIPLNLGLCAQCREEMLDPSSRRYYYPFTSCRHCGGQYGFFERYPYIREHTSWKFVQPCTACQAELDANPFRREQAQISCHDCGIAVAMTHKGKARYANDAPTFKQLFEIAAKGVSEGHDLVMKTTFGYRRFYALDSEHPGAASILLHINHRDLMDDLSLTRQEIEALYSLEKPVIKVATRSEKMKTCFGSVVRCKIADEAFTVLLAKELETLGIDAIAYEPCSEAAEAAYRVDFDLPLAEQSDMELFIASERHCIRSGERVSFPARIITPVDTLSVTEELVAVNFGRHHRIDRMEHFEGAEAGRMTLIEGCESSVEHSNTHRFSAAHGAMMGALASHGVRSSAVGVYFETDVIEFVYYNGSHISTIVPYIPFEPKHLIEKLSALREGSDRLMANIEANRPELFKTLERVEREGLGLFEAAAVIIGLEGRGFEALDNTALEFMGKGGTQIDTMIKDTRFNPYAFLASIISYKMADVEPVILSYSLFESLGDYFVDILMQIQAKSKAEQIVLCGSQIAQSSLYGRIVQKMKTHTPLLNRSFPIGEEGAVVGGIYL